jgi:hypothetical protein
MSRHVENVGDARNVRNAVLIIKSASSRHFTFFAIWFSSTDALRSDLPLTLAQVPTLALPVNSRPETLSYNGHHQESGSSRGAQVYSQMATLMA